MNKKLLSGVKPTGHPHIGNYFGAMKQFVDLQNSGKYDCLFMVADYHALNLIQNGSEMKQLIYDLVVDYLALGMDPEKSIIFKQSDVSAHTELAWIFDTIVTMPYLMRAHAYKDAEAKNKEINVGTFNYPVLMSADILLYDTDIVPVGQDQKQHVEYTRDIAQKFNNIFGETFKLPEELILDNVANVPGIDGRKMSKSYSNTVPLFATRDEIISAVMSIVTDSGTGVPTNVYNIHKLFKNEIELKNLYDTNTGKYKILKEALIEDIDAFIKPLREARMKFAGDEKLINKILEKGAERAQNFANNKLLEVKEKIGVFFNQSKLYEANHKNFKDYKHWNNLKQHIHNYSENKVHFHEREIWYCHIGENVGFEQDGKGIEFLRPVLIIRKFNNEIFWAVPLTSKIKKSKFYYNIKIKNTSESSAILSQLKLIDSKRMSHKIGVLPKDEFNNLTKKLKELIP